MKVNFQDGSFMLAWEKCRAWYHADGTLKDAEYKYTYRGRPAARAIPSNHRRTLDWLKKQGRQEIEFLAKLADLKTN